VATRRRPWCPATCLTSRYSANSTGHLRPGGPFLIGPLGEKIEPGFFVNFPQDQVGIPPVGPPALGEETFEWLALLQSILDAKARFVMVEAGAGFGRWLVTAACALRQRRPALSFFFVGIEAEPAYFHWMSRHFLNNGIDPSDHRLVHGAVAAHNGDAQLIVGMEGTASEWYKFILIC
jgi:hypothetical protein